MAPTLVRRLWRRDPDQPEYLDAEDVYVLERARRGAVVLAALATIGVVAAYSAAGFAGLLVALSVVAGGVLLALVLGVPAGPTPRRPPRVRTPSFDEPYPTFREVSEQLSWAQVSPRHYDLMTRPLFVRLLANRLESHHGVDLHRAPEAARVIVGDDVWWWVDPGRPAEASSQPPGVDVRTLARIVDRLEHL